MEPISQLWTSWPHARSGLAALSSDHGPPSVPSGPFTSPPRRRSSRAVGSRPSTQAPAGLSLVLGQCRVGHGTWSHDPIRCSRSIPREAPAIASRLRESWASERLRDLPRVTQLSSEPQDLNRDPVASRLWGSRRQLRCPPYRWSLAPRPWVETGLCRWRSQGSGRRPRPLPWARHGAVSSPRPSTPASPADVFVRGDRGTGRLWLLPATQPTQAAGVGQALGSQDSARPSGPGGLRISQIPSRLLRTFTGAGPKAGAPAATGALSSRTSESGWVTARQGA